MASTSEPDPAPNSLGLNFDQLKIQDPPDAEPKSEEPPQSPSQDAAAEGEKKKPYVNPERVKTGGNQRDKLSEEALSERMARMREQNEKIKQRRLDVQADEEAFKKTQETERVKLAQSRKVQESVDRTREQNAKRKLDKMQNREWDSGKPVGGSDWKQRQTPNKTDSAPRPPQKAETPADEVKTEAKAETKSETTSTPTSPSPANDSGNWTRGGSPRGGRGGVRGRGRGRGGATGTTGGTQKPAEADAVPKDAPPHIAPKDNGVAS
ncbi:hypothetical protein DFH08DRAFT_778566 [Mycena albidolilacea]|uniref:Uncharacterized protein n=1 Tax=Mycena albidolilacea TaxID=1033008 RepID=A0AAD7A4K0_9AGAR|nr:hypothetical protein DFH08DRAFT_778566 [Mycena albidolilacea]